MTIHEPVARADRRIRRPLLLAGVAVIGLITMAGCAPPVTIGPRTGEIQVCAPSSTLLRAIQIRVDDLGSGGGEIHISMGEELKDHSDAFERTFDVTTPVSQGTYTPPFVPDPGRCLTVNATNGLTFRTTLVPETDFATIITWLSGPVIHGHPPTP